MAPAADMGWNGHDVEDDLAIAAAHDAEADAERARLLRRLADDQRLVDDLARDRADDVRP